MTMSPKEKAIQVCRNYIALFNSHFSKEVKDCGIICVDEVIKELDEGCKELRNPQQIKYWLAVRTEIEQL